MEKVITLLTWSGLISYILTISFIMACILFKFRLTDKQYLLVAILLGPVGWFIIIVTSAPPDWVDKIKQSLRNKQRY
jgi:hypothetical protein